MVHRIPHPWLASIATLVIFTVCATSSTILYAQEGFELNDQTFDQWVYNSSQGKFDPVSELTLNIEAVDQVCELSKSQEEKLKMAAKGDYARFSRKVDELKAEYVGKTYDQEKIGEIYQKIHPLAQVYQAGLLGKDSLFVKALHRSLSSEQRAKFDEAESKRAKARYESKVRMFVAMLERSCPLTTEQRDKLVELLLNETKPPKYFGQYDWYVIMYQAHKLPDEKYQPLLDEAQLKQLRVNLRQGAGMEHFLRQQKIIDE